MPKTQFHAPDDLSPEGKELLNRIGERINNAKVINNLIVVGSAVAAGESLGTSTLELPETVEALGQLDKIVTERIRTDIDLTNLNRAMSKEERQFFDNVRSTIDGRAQPESPAGPRVDPPVSEEERKGYKEKGRHIFDGSRCWCGFEGPRGKSDKDHVGHNMSGARCWCGATGMHGGQPR